MCGFLASFTYNPEKIIEHHDFETLLAKSKHRGPDNTLILNQENFQLGFNRLSILDLSESGNQPKTSPTKRYHIVCNGEIYNFKALAKKYNLQNLHPTSDTEVVVQLCDAIGVENTIKALNGMFAIAISDTESKTFYLSRDFAGIKPLFYGIHNNGVVAASQFDQIFNHPWFESQLKLRPNIVKEFFGFGYMQAPNTIYEHIFQVNPGDLVQIDINGIVQKKNILSFKKHQVGSNLNFNNSNLSQLLKSVVHNQLISDVPVATFLSGGIDSPLITAYAKQGNPNIEAFTLKVNHSELNESDIAEAYAKQLKISQHIIEVDENDLLERIDAHFLAFAEPFGDYSSIPTYVIAEEAKKHYTVMLSGDGGDELFFGYPRMLDVLNKRFWFKLPLILRKTLVRITNKFKITNTWAPLYKNLSEFITHKHIQLPQNVLNKSMAYVDFSEEMKNLYKFDNKNSKDLLHQLRWNEFYAHMQRVLMKVDRASMKHGLEVRVPFLDKESIEYAWNMVGLIKSKADLKKALKSLLSLEVSEKLINKKKMGFTVPLNTWLHNQLKDDVIKHIFDTPFYGSDIIDVEVLKDFTKDFYEHKHDHVWGIWHIYAWQKWAKLHLY